MSPVSNDRTAPFAVIFDLDGVIVSTDAYHRQAWQRLADELGLPFTEAQAQATRGVDRMASLAIVLGAAASRFTAEEQAALAARKNATYKELIRGISARDLLPGVIALLDELETARVPRAIGSASRNADAVLRARRRYSPSFVLSYAFMRVWTMAAFPDGMSPSWASRIGRKRRASVLTLISKPPFFSSQKRRTAFVTKASPSFRQRASFVASYNSRNPRARNA